MYDKLLLLNSDEDDIYSLAVLSYIFSSLILVIDSVSVYFWKVNSLLYERLVWTLIRGMFEFAITLLLFVCIHIIWFATVYMWGNSSTYPLLILGKNLPTMVFSWRRKRHDYLFCFCKIFPQYNRNKTWNLIRSSMSW